MAYTSTEVKRRWNAEHYKTLSISVPIDLGDAFKAKCKEEIVPQRGVIIDIITEYLEGKNDGQY